MIKAYMLLTKPGIVLGNLLTAAAGFALGLRGIAPWWQWGGTLSGIALIIASGCVWNNWIDRRADQKMVRTARRGLAAGIVSELGARLWGTLLGGTSLWILYETTSLLTMILALLGFGIYVGIYSFLKYHSIQATLVGSVAGAMPPLAGYASAKGDIDLVGGVVFLILVFWQMPHFLAIALYRSHEYEKAGIPTYPSVKGVASTQRQMKLYTLLFTLSSLTLGYVSPSLGWVYVTIMSASTLYWMYILFQRPIERYAAWGRSMFRWSLVVIVGWCAVVVYLALEHPTQGGVSIGTKTQILPLSSS
jgi:protoheme IX farnesyltransferase